MKIQPKRFSHVERARRRKRIAIACRTRCIEDVSSEEGVAIQTVQHACREHGVPFKRYRRKRVEKLETTRWAFGVVAELKLRMFTLDTLGLRHGVSRQRIQQIECMAIETKLLPPRSKGNKQIRRKDKP